MDFLRCLLTAIDLSRFARRRPPAAELRPRDARHGNAGPGDLQPGELLAEREPRHHAGDRRRQVHERRRARDAAHVVHPGPHQPAAHRREHDRPEEPEPHHRREPAEVRREHARQADQDHRRRAEEQCVREHDERPVAFHQRARQHRVERKERRRDEQDEVAEAGVQAAGEFVRQEYADARHRDERPGDLARAQALGAEQYEDREREERPARQHQRRGEGGRQADAPEHDADVQRMPDQPAGNEARQVLALRPGARDAVAEHEQQQQEREQRHRDEADEEKRPDAERVEQVLDEGEVHAPQDHREERGEERPAAGGHRFAQSRILRHMKFETPPPLPLGARAAVQALAASKIRELYNESFGRKDVLAFWVGEPDEPTPEFIRKAATESIGAGELFYTHNLGIPQLREVLAAYVSRLHRKTDPGQIAVTSAGVNALMLASQLLVDPGDHVVEVVPLWPNLQEIPKILGARVTTVALDFSPAGWTLDLGRLMEALKPGTRVLYLNSPNNPTGWTITREEQKAILGHCRRHGIWIFADDAYERLYFGLGGVAPSFLDAMHDDDRVII